MDFQSQTGGCLCSDIRYCLDDDPLTVYACHCTDCQRQSGSSFTLSMVVRREVLKLLQGQPDEFVVELSDGRRKQASYCRRCCTRLWNPAPWNSSGRGKSADRVGLLALEPREAGYREYDRQKASASGRDGERPGKVDSKLRDAPHVVRENG